MFIIHGGEKKIKNDLTFNLTQTTFFILKTNIMIDRIKNFFKNKYQTVVDEHNRFGTISVLLIVVAIFGGVAIGYNMDSLLAMILITTGTMLTEAFILAVQPMKRIVNISMAASLINLIFIFIGFFS